MHLGLAALGLILSGCAALDPGNVGSGYYFQVLNASGTVIRENDSAKNGYLNCTHSATQLIQSNPGLKGRILCAQLPTTQPLPYSIKIYNLDSVAGNAMRPTSAFFSRHATSASCDAEVVSRRADKKWVILENNCAAASAQIISLPPVSAKASTAIPAQQNLSKPASPNSRYLQINRYQEMVGQFDLTTTQQCQGELEAIKKLLTSTTKDNLELNCSAFDGKLSFRVVVRDELLDNLITITSKTKPFCLLMVAQITKASIPEINKPRYSFVSQCS